MQREGACEIATARCAQIGRGGGGERPFFFGDDDTYRDARFKLTPRMLDSNWVVRKAVGQRPAVLGKQLKQWYWRGADYLEIDIDIGSSQIAAGVVRRTPERRCAHRCAR